MGSLQSFFSHCSNQDDVELMQLQNNASMAAAQAGLRATSGGNFAIPLTEVHFRAKLLDLAAEVKRNLGYS